MPVQKQVLLLQAEKRAPSRRQKGTKLGNAAKAAISAITKRKEAAAQRARKAESDEEDVSEQQAREAAALEEAAAREEARAMQEDEGEEAGSDYERDRMDDAEAEVLAN